MIRLSDIRIRPKLIILFLLTGVIPLITVGLFGSNLATNSLMEKSFNQLTTVQIIRKDQIQDFFKSRLADIHVLADSTRVISLVDALKDYEKAAEADGTKFNTYSTPYQALTQPYHHSLKLFVDEYGYHDMFIVDAQHGDVLFSVAGEDDLGSNLTHGKYSETGLARAWRQAMETGTTAIADFQEYSPSGGMQSAFMAHPIVSSAGEITAVLVLQLTDSLVTQAVDSRQGMGTTGESYLLGVSDNNRHFELRSSLKTMGDGKYVVGYSISPLNYWLDAVRDGVNGGFGVFN